MAPLGRGEPRLLSRGPPMAQGFHAPVPPALEPLENGPGCDAEGFGNAALAPALLVQRPGLEPAAFPPVDRFLRKVRLHSGVLPAFRSVYISTHASLVGQLQ